MYDFLLIKVLASLALILLSIYFAFLLVKKRLGIPQLAERKIIIVEHKKIDHGASIALIKLEHSNFLVALSSNAIAIHKLE